MAVNTECYCSVTDGLRAYWEADAHLQELVPSCKGKENRFFEYGLAQVRDGIECDCYVVLSEVGGAIKLNETDTGAWFQESYIFRIYAKNPGKAREILEWLRCNWIQGVCTFCLECGCFSKVRLSSYSNVVLLPTGYYRTTLTITGQRFDDRAACLGSD